MTCLSAGSPAGVGGVEADCSQRVSGLLPYRKGNTHQLTFDLWQFNSVMDAAVFQPACLIPCLSPLLRCIRSWVRLTWLWWTSVGQWIWILKEQTTRSKKPSTRDTCQRTKVRQVHTDQSAWSMIDDVRQVHTGLWSVCSCVHWNVLQKAHWVCSHSVNFKSKLKTEILSLTSAGPSDPASNQ